MLVIIGRLVRYINNSIQLNLFCFVNYKLRISKLFRFQIFQTKISSLAFYIIIHADCNFDMYKKHITNTFIKYIFILFVLNVNFKIVIRFVINNSKYYQIPTIF